MSIPRRVHYCQGCGARLLRRVSCEKACPGCGAPASRVLVTSRRGNPCRDLVRIRLDVPRVWLLEMQRGRGSVQRYAREAIAAKMGVPPP